MTTALATATARETIADALKWGRRALADAGIDSAALDARVLLGAGLDVAPGALVAMAARALSPAEADAFGQLIRGRAGRRPVSRLLGRRGFWTLELELDDAVLDPRPDSETLVEAVLARRPDRRPLSVLDLGVGSGCLLLSLLHELPGAWGVGVDLSAAAIACARANAARLGFGDRAVFLVGNWAAALTRRFDIVVCNPPYIGRVEIDGLQPEVRDHDPHLALDGGVDGLDCFRAIAMELPSILASEGVAVVECGAGQARQAADIFTEAGLLISELRRDLAGVPRCLIVSATD